MATGQSQAIASASYKTQPLHLKLILAAILFAPLQAAFTINVGFPFKVSEALVIAAVILYPLTRRGGTTPALERRLVVGLGLLVMASSAIHLATPPPAGSYPGFSRSPVADAALYLAYAGLILVFWILASSLPAWLIKGALLFSVWLALAATIMQFALFSSGHIALLDSLGFETSVRSHSLDGSGEGAMRSGPFTEGQHLGFFSGGMLILAWRWRSYWTLCAAAVCLIYSQSTTGIAGVAIALIAMVVLRPGVRMVMRLVVGLITSTALILLVPELQNLLRLQLAKLGLFGFEETIRGAGQSMEVRALKSDIGFQMMMDNPLIGVGPGRFGYWYFTYPLSAESPKYYFNGDSRALAENVYLHIGSEFGILALGCFVAFISILIVKLRKGFQLDFALSIFVAVSISTQSSWTFMPVWIFLAYLASTVWSAPKIRTSSTRPLSTPQSDPSQTNVDSRLLAQ